MRVRQAERIEQAMREAMLSLLHERPFEKITVKDLVERAGVSKSTFYAHYPTLFALVQDCYLHDQVYFGRVQKRRSDYANRTEACLELLDTIANRLAFFKANPNLAHVILYNTGISPYFSESIRAEEDLHIDHLLTEYGSPAEDYQTFENSARFTVAGRNGVLRAWLEGGMVESVEQMTKFLVFCALQLTAGMADKSIEPEYKAAIDAWHYRS